MPVITFSLPQSSYDALASKALDDSESPNLVAKRLILGFLGDNNQLSLDESSKLLSRIESLESRLDDTLDGTALDDNLDESSKVLGRIKTLESLLDDSLDGKGLEEAIANHPKLKGIEDTLNELKDTFDDIYHRFYQESKENNVFVPLMTQEAETKYLDSQPTENKPSENALQDASNDNQVLEDISDTTPLDDPMSEDNPDAIEGDNSEPPINTGIEDNGGDGEIETAIADQSKKGLTGKELAEKLGVRADYFSRWKKGEQVPKEDSKNYQAYQEFLKYSYEKREGDKKEKYYLIP